jgi:proteasome lid subunit RPN8/RPN11
MPAFRVADGEMTETFELRRAHWEQMSAHVRRHWPEEACGLLGGPPGRAEVVHPVENVLHSRVAYEMDPRAQVEAMMALEARGWDVTAIFHSHPAGPPAPSPTDVAKAYYPEAVYLIWAPDGEGGWLARGFRLEAGRVREVEVSVTE